jgi:hypothetical protein
MADGLRISMHGCDRSATGQDSVKHLNSAAVSELDGAVNNRQEAVTGRVYEPADSCGQR